MNLKTKELKSLPSIPEAISFLKTTSGLNIPAWTTKLEFYDEEHNFCFAWDNIEDLIKNHGNIYFNKKEYKTANGFRKAFIKRYNIK